MKITKVFTQHDLMAMIQGHIIATGVVPIISENRNVKFRLSWKVDPDKPSDSRLSAHVEIEEIKP